MDRSSAFVQHVLELMAPLGPVRARAMFGGFGIYQGDIMFAIVTRDRLYIKVDKETRPDFLARGMAAFTYFSRGRETSLQYFEAPPEALETQDEMRDWGQRGLSAALRSKKAGRALETPRKRVRREV